MHFPAPYFQPKDSPEPSPAPRTEIRENVLWDRPVFKAPPLVLHPQPFDAKIFAQELPRLNPGLR
jgi:hypothetical protein